MAPLLEVDTWPELRDPVLVVDALRAGSTRGWPARARSRCCRSSSTPSAVFGRIDLSDLMDLQQTRPDGAPRRRRVAPDHVAVDRPSSPAVAGATSSCASGPSRRCAGARCSGRSSTAAQRLGVTRAFTVGGIPSVASHRRPVEVLATGTSEESGRRGRRVAQGLHRPHRRAERAPGAARRGGRPHGRALGAGAALRGRRARRPRRSAPLLARLRELGGVASRPVGPRRPGAGLRAAGRGGHRRASRRASRRSRRSSRSTETPPLPSGDELASEIERFLRGPVREADVRSVAKPA